MRLLHINNNLTAILLLVLAVCAEGNAAASDASCVSDTTTRAYWLNLRDSGFVADDADIQTLARQLLPCLVSRDPVLRDQVAFEGLSHWARTNKLKVDTANALTAELVTWFDKEFEDLDGVSKPFAMLMLSELVRMDRIDPFFSSVQRQRLVNLVVDYMTSLRDYRGFDSDVGWRHGVAHSADMVLQLALNANIDAVQLKALAMAIVDQVAPTGEHFYVYGESQRLARAIFYLLQRNAIEVSWWDNWFSQLLQKTDQNLFQSQTGLTRRHNLQNFLMVLYFYVKENGDQGMQANFLPPIVNGIDALG